MKTKEQYFKACREEEEEKKKVREEKYRNETLIEISDWSIEKLKEEYVKISLSKISFYDPFSSGMLWDWLKEECRFCDLEYVEGKHNDCCDEHYNLFELSDDVDVQQDTYLDDYDEDGDLLPLDFNKD